ncbi:MAG: FAD-dependent oxidoreductase [Myxococcales bacterium]|nr:FAD-dependent oxidoreductase [Myxococcales bacterium]MCB9541022.1 FAD-dependent oxidoreductase [Myxococcales bacterium]
MRPAETTDTLIIGAGLAGLSCALHLDRPALIVEAAAHVGGKAMSEQHDGFTFDVTGHWLHLRDPAMRALALKLCGEDHFMRISRISRIWSHGVYTRYPYQANTWGLPPEVVLECVMGAIEADRRRPATTALEDEPENFADWIRYYFGEGIARHFMIPYNAKLWGVPADEITSRWCQRFVPRPALTDIVAGAVGCNEKAMGYNAEFLYPRTGGIQTLAEALADAVGRERITLGDGVASIDPEARVATLHSGRRVAYRHLVSTMQLPRLVDALTDVPAAVRAARAKLRGNEVRYLNVGVDGPLGQPDHWIYVPEELWPFYRVGSFSNANPAMAPAGMSSLYIEMSDRDTPLDALRDRIGEGLVAMGLIDTPARVRFMHERRIHNAYVIYDFAYHDSRAAVHAWLDEQGIASIGRYGDWNYSSMEDALIDGRTAAEKLGAKPR